MKNLLTLAILFCFCKNINAQTDYPWRKDFPDADAVFTNLSREINIKLENGKLSAVSNYSEDMLYITDNSVKLMNRGRIYHSSFHELKKWDAYVQAGGSKKMKYVNATTKNSTQDYIFYDDSKATTFDYTGAVVGATRHLEYELYHNDGHMLTPHYFERYFPVLNGELKIVFPEEVSVKYLIKGNNADKVSFAEQKKRGKTIYSFRINNVSGSQNYEDAPDNSYYDTHIVFYVDKIKENGQWKNYLSTTDDLYQTYQGYVKGLNKSAGTELKNIVDSLTKNSTDPLTKANKIYKWVQRNIKYVAFEEGLEGFVPREADLVCSRRFGDCKDMASILSVMLNYAGVPAYLTWIGTREIPYSYSETPLPIVDNHMICAIRSGNDFIFLDGTDNACVFGKPPIGIQGKEALIGISEKEYKVVKVPVVDKMQNVYVDSSFLQLTDKGLAGKLKIYMTGYYATSMRSVMDYKSQEEKDDYYKNRFGRGSNKIKFSNWNTQISDDHNQAWVTADFELKDYAKKIGDEWILNLNLFKWYEHQEIDYPKRKTPIQYSFLKHASYVTALQIPQGFTVSFIPQNETYKNDVWGFVMNYTSQKEHVYLTQEFDTDQLLLQPSQFEQWNKVLEHLFPHYKQTVVLSKK